MTNEVSKELLEAAEEYEHIKGYVYYPSINDAFIAGAEWQRAKMMEGAIEGTVCKGEPIYKGKKEVWIELIPEALPNFKDMQPVKVIVIKDDRI